jgi:hypothetical protein
MNTPDSCNFCDVKPEKLFKVLETTAEARDTAQFRFAHACQQCVDAKGLAETIVEEIKLAN